MTVVAPGVAAPPVPGVSLTEPMALFFYKVTCPTCRLAAPAVQRYEEAYPGRIAGVGQDPPERLEAFAREHGVTFGSVADLPPYPVSEAYGIRVVPTLVLVGGDGTVLGAVESWDREGANEVSRRLAEATRLPYVAVSEAGDGRPPFRPG